MTALQPVSVDVEGGPEPLDRLRVGARKRGERATASYIVRRVNSSGPAPVRQAGKDPSIPKSLESADRPLRLSHMGTVIGVLVLALGLILLWTGRQRFEFNSFQTTLLSILEIAGLVVSLVALGWLGIGVLIGVNVVAALVWSGILAARKQSILVNASVQSTEMSVEEADEVWKWMSKQKAFAVIRPLERGELIRALAEQARAPNEIRPMAMAIALLSVNFGCDPIRLAPQFDQLLRLYDKSASDSEEVADTLTVATQRSAASFEDMLVAMIVAKGGSAPQAQVA